MLLGATPDVRIDLGAAGVVVRPIRIGREGIRIEVVGNVDTQVGVGVLEPGAADIGVLVEDGVRDARLLEPNRRAEAAEAGADDADVEFVESARGGRVLPDESPRVVSVEIRFFDHELHVLGLDLLPGAEVHDAVQQGAFDRPTVERCAPIDHAEYFDGDGSDLVGFAR